MHTMKGALVEGSERSAAQSTNHDRAFASLEETLRLSGPQTALEELIRHLDETGDYRALLDALVLKARHELGLPLIQVGALSELDEPARSRYEDKYVEAIRLVGSKYLASGDIPAAWSYFRAIAEPEAVCTALESYEATDDVERTTQIIDVAFNQGANIKRGFELILDTYGTCSAITALEQIPAADRAAQAACIERLIRRMHRDLVASLRADIAQRGQPLPPEGTTIAGLVGTRDWLFSDEGYHIDISHLSAAVRYSVLISDLDSIAQAVDLSEYGRRLSPRLQFEGVPPFERIFEDHRRYLRALLGEDVDAAISHFQDKLAPLESGDLESSLPAQVLVNLLSRIGRFDEAIEVFAKHLAALPESALNCPGLGELCLRGGRKDRLATISRQHGDLVHFLAAQL
jgi:tetratricopeptide (TPR) repeat protein